MSKVVEAAVEVVEKEIKRSGKRRFADRCAAAAANCTEAYELREIKSAEIKPGALVSLLLYTDNDLHQTCPSLRHVILAEYDEKNRRVVLLDTLSDDMFVFDMDARSSTSPKVFPIQQHLIGNTVIRVLKKLQQADVKDLVPKGGNISIRTSELFPAYRSTVYLGVTRDSGVTFTECRLDAREILAAIGNTKKFAWADEAKPMAKGDRILILFTNN